MKVAIISESPSLATGFGTTTKKIIEIVSRKGFDIACFGIGAIGETFNRILYPCRIWAVGVTNLKEQLALFLRHEQPDVVLIHKDVIDTGKWVQLIRAAKWQGPIIAYFVLDGHPIFKRHLSFLSDVQERITATHATARYLESEGFSGISVIPHGIDHSVFYPLPYKDSLRKKAGLEDQYPRQNDHLAGPVTTKHLYGSIVTG